MFCSRNIASITRAFATPAPPAALFRNVSSLVSAQPDINKRLSYHSSYSNSCDKLRSDLYRSCTEESNSLPIVVVTENLSGSHSQKIGILETVNGDCDRM